MSRSSNDAESAGLRILSLDGDGVGVLSELVIVRELMHRIQFKLDLPTIPRPCDWFQLIGGSGTGGLVAILLGRLGLPIDEATRCYLEIMDQVFSKRRTKPHSRAAELERMLKILVENRYGDPDVPMIETCEEYPMCKVVVYAMATACLQAGTPICVRSYRVAENQGPECSIVEAILMTTATPDAIMSKAIYDEGVETSYIGAGLGCNNPTARLLIEVGQAYPDQPAACIVSTSAGQRGPINIRRPKGLLDHTSAQLGAATEAIAKDCERVHEEVAVRFSHTEGLYFRFNPEQGNQGIDQYDTSKLSDINAYAKAYLTSTLINTRLNDAVKAVMNGREAAMLLYGNVVPIFQNCSSLGRCPAPTPMFTGREDLLEKIRTYFFNQPRERHLFVLHGLGGSGKTQLALMFVNRYKKMFWDVFYIDATTNDTIKAGFGYIGKKARAGDKYEDALEWLASQDQRWLIVYNNADDPAIDLSDYFPNCAHGDILITTRNRDMIIHSPDPDAHCHIGDMAEDEATTLLFKTSGVAVTPTSREEANYLVEMLGFLALAIVQSGAYIHSTQCSLGAYGELFLSSRDRLLRTRRVSQTDGYKLTAYATWDVSYQNPLLMPRAAQLLGIMSFMHHDEISAHLFETAATRITNYQPTVPLDEREKEMRDIAADFLGSLTTPNKSWDALGWQELIGNLRSFSLLDYDPIGQTYSMHPLVHSWCRSVVSDPGGARESAAWVLALCSKQDPGPNDWRFWDLLSWHALALLAPGSTITPTLAFDLHIIFSKVQMLILAGIVLAGVLQASEERLGHDHPQTVMLTQRLAFVYRARFRYGEAEPLLNKVLDSQKRLLGDEHPVTLSTRYELGSMCYSKVSGQLDKSKLLLKEVLEVEKRVLGQDHQDVRRIIEELVSTCTELGQWSEAEALQTELLEICSREFNGDHSIILIALVTLSNIYYKLGRREDAEELTTRIIKTTKRILGDEFADMIPYVALMALSYHLDGRLTETELLQVVALEASKEFLGEKHAATLVLMHDLSITKFHQEKAIEGGELKKQVFELMGAPLSERKSESEEDQEDVEYDKEAQIRKFFKLWTAMLHSTATRRVAVARERGSKSSGSSYFELSTVFLVNCGRLFDGPSLTSDTEDDSDTGDDSDIGSDPDTEFVGSP